jgi:predicted metal-dependent hydrolase
MAFSEKSIVHRDFGKINIIKSTRASRISISIRPFEPLRLTVPMFVSASRAEEFLHRKEKWIHKNLEKIRRLEESYTVFTERTPFRTREHELVTERSGEGDARVMVRGGKISVRLSLQADMADPGIQEIIRQGIEAAWKKEAKKYLPRRLEELSHRNNLTYNRVIIKNNRTRWGSCSQKNNINLSLHLMRLPDHLIDYILLHELVHTVHKNHGRKFWMELERICPDARAADRKLQEYRMDIY